MRSIRMRLVPISLLLLAQGVSARATRLVVVGKVTDDSGAAILNAVVRILQDNRPSRLLPQAVDFEGKFKIAADVDPQANLTCEIAAAGFESQTRTLVVDRGTIDVGTARLKRVLGLKINGVTLNDDYTGSVSFLDVAFTNESNQPITIISQHLSGTARSKTGCSDLTPNISFGISPDLKQITVQEADSGFSEKIAGEGRVDFLPCQQVRIDLRIKTLLTVRPDGPRRIRLSIPHYLVSAEGTQSRNLLLTDWAQLQITFTLSDQTAVQARVR